MIYTDKSSHKTNNLVPPEIHKPQKSPYSDLISKVRNLFMPFKNRNTDNVKKEPDRNSKPHLFKKLNFCKGVKNGVTEVTRSQSNKNYETSEATHAHDKKYTSITNKNSNSPNVTNKCVANEKNIIMDAIVKELSIKNKDIPSTASPSLHTGVSSHVEETRKPRIPRIPRIPREQFESRPFDQKVDFFENYNKKSDSGIKQYIDNSQNYKSQILEKKPVQKLQTKDIPVAKPRHSLNRNNPATNIIMEESLDFKAAKKTDLINSNGSGNGKLNSMTTIEDTRW